MLVAIVGIDAELAPVVAAVISLEMDAQTLIAPNFDPVPRNQALLLIVEGEEIASRAKIDFLQASVVDIALTKGPSTGGAIDATRLLSEIVRALSRTDDLDLP